ncbi:UDP-N-acetylmuramate--L-alanine ligase [Petroclostridium sp. X23]|uniref:UDP-N-acetylmuramate--L-alanine ligase n=1 Tax=Petroclostridium sp. X23 TaxID=3045146 RepID=UPI0024ACFDF4|nr:UDP-N-acetylmuramate--L-alanine ligase [Petroclostridium sp. X23]WHH57600.1 UDP-N-acetylmuramate--L-alanine ligase [Petroclostridium sp. X23]
MTEFKLELLKAGTHVHFVGIGGISMSALAEILVSSGFIVSGSDMKESPLTDKLKRLGVKFFLHHSENNIDGADLIVYTAAVKDFNPEIQAGKKLGIPIIERPVLLGEIMKKYHHAVAVAGTHGKTTTTSMISSIMLNAKLDPTVLVGGELDAIGGNVRTGKSTYFVTEACEYVESFLKFYPYIGVILNIEEDHLDYFKDLSHIIEAFRKFAALVPEDGYIVACGDDPNVLQALEGINCTIFTYSIKDGHYDWKAENITFSTSGFPKFDILYRGSKLASIQLNIPGMHNVYNALAAAACAYAAGIPVECIVDGLFSFRGTHRRFEIKGCANGITVVDDYAHHPTEVKATLGAASRFPHKKLWCIFQPHTYTRTYALLNEFSNAFYQADKVIITDIYAAREPDDGKIHSKNLVEKLAENGCNAQYISSFDEITSYILQNVQEGDVIITMGAGDVHRVGEMFLEKCELDTTVRAMA